MGDGLLLLHLPFHYLRSARVVCGPGDVGLVQLHHCLRPFVLLHSIDLPHGRQDHWLWALQYLLQDRRLRRTLSVPVR